MRKQQLYESENLKVESKNTKKIKTNLPNQKLHSKSFPAFPLTPTYTFCSLTQLQ